MEITGTMKKRILLVGKAASGKDYFKDFMKNQGYPCDISYTTWVTLVFHKIFKIGRAHV